MKDIKAFKTMSFHSKMPSNAGSRTNSNLKSRLALRSKTWGFKGDDIKLKSSQEERTVKVKIYKIVDKIGKFLNLGHLVLFMRMVLVDFMTPIAINITFLHSTSYASIANWLIALSIISIYILVWVYGCTIMRKTDIFLVKKSRNP